MKKEIDRSLAELEGEILTAGPCMPWFPGRPAGPAGPCWGKRERSDEVIKEGETKGLKSKKF